MGIRPSKAARHGTKLPFFRLYRPASDVGYRKGDTHKFDVSEDGTQRVAAETMKYVITARSSDSISVKASGSWLVEAANPDDALDQIQDYVRTGFWPKDSTWTVRPSLCEDAQTSI